MDFEFYGATYTDLYASSNGLITFGAGDSSWTNDDLTTSPSQATIAVFWDDMHISGGTDSYIYYQVLGAGDNQQLVIQWNDIRFHNGLDMGQITFQAVLSESDNSIQLNYLDLASAVSGAEGASATVGVKDIGEQGLNRLLLCYNDGPNTYVGTGKSTRIAAYPEARHRVIISEGEIAEDVDFGGYAQPGDGDLDGDVDLDDFVILKSNFGRTDARWDQGDFDGNQIVDLSDFVILKNNFGTTATPITMAGSLRTIAKVNAQPTDQAIAPTPPPIQPNTVLRQRYWPTSGSRPGRTPHRSHGARQWASEANSRLEELDTIDILILAPRRTPVTI